MSTFQTLTDAFAELERRADEASASLPAEPAHHAPARHRTGLLLIAAAVVAVLAVVAATTLLVHGRTSRPSGTDAAAGPTNAATQPAKTSTNTKTFRIPRTPAELASRFRAVLGDTATFTVTDTGAPVSVTVPGAPTQTAPAAGGRTAPAASGRTVPAAGGRTAPAASGRTVPPAVPNRSTGYRGAVPASGQAVGAAIVGTLTASGVTGGFDLQIFRDEPGGTAQCDDPDRARCTVRRLADGSSLALGREPLQGARNALTYQVNLVRPDGVEFLMHVSNERDPKGASAVLAARPPLTREQMTAIVVSDRW